MMTLEQNIMAVLESNFSGIKDEIKELALKAILELIENDRTTHGGFIEITDEMFRKRRKKKMPKRKTVIQEIKQTHEELVRMYFNYYEKEQPEAHEDVRTMSSMIEAVRKLKERFMTAVEIQEEMESDED